MSDGQMPPDMSSPAPAPSMVATIAAIEIAMMARIIAASTRSIRLSGTGAFSGTRQHYAPHPRPHEQRKRPAMPTGKVKFYDEEKGFGFVTSDDGQEVFLHASALPAGAVVRAGTRLEFGIADGRKGAQALSVRVLDAPPSLSKLTRRSADDMAIVIEDLVKLLDGIGAGLRRGRYPDRAHGAKIAAVLRKVADDLDA